MAIKDVERFKRNPTSGVDAGNQAVTDANIKALDRIAIPANETNTFNGGKVENGVVNLSRNSDGDLVFQSYADGKWTEYLAVLDGLKSIGGITLDGNEVTVVAPVKWRINSVNYQKLTDTVITVNSATDGFKRIDYIYADTNNNILLIEGTEVADGNPYIPPTLPVNTVMVAPVYISGSTVIQPVPDLSIYITKSQADSWYSVISPSGAYIQASPMEPQTAYISISGEVYATTFVPLNSPYYFKSFDAYLPQTTVEDRLAIIGELTLNTDDALIRQRVVLNPDAPQNPLDSILMLPPDSGTLSRVEDFASAPKITGSSLFTVTDPKDYVQAGNVTLKQQKVVYADNYTDEFTGFESDGFNYGSAIWKIINEYNYQNVKIILSAKRYKPLQSQEVLFQPLSDITIQGQGMPRFKDGLTTIENGTIIEGCIRILNPSNNLTFKDFGIDAGLTVTDTYYDGQGIDGFAIGDYVPTQFSYGKNIIMENVMALLRSPYVPYHGILIERIDGGYVNNIRACFGAHGIAIKSRFINFGSIESYGNTSDYVIIKSGEINTFAQGISINNIVGAPMPKEVSSSYVTIPQVEYGLYFDAQATLTGVWIDKVYISNSNIGIVFNPRSTITMGAIQINNAYVEYCNYDISRGGEGVVSLLNIEALTSFENTINIVDFIQGNNDKNIRIGSISANSSTNSPKNVNSFKIRNSILVVDNYIDPYATTGGVFITDIDSSSRLSINNIQSNTLNINRNFGIYSQNLTYDALLKTKLPGNIVLGNGTFTEGEAGFYLDSLRGTVQIIDQGTMYDYFVGDRLGLPIITIPTGTKNINLEGNVLIKPLAGTGNRPVSVAADGTLGIDTGGARLTGGNVFTGGHQDVRSDGDFRVYNTASGASNYNSTLNSGGVVLTSIDQNTTTLYGQNFIQRLNSAGFYSRLKFNDAVTANAEYILPKSGGDVPVVLPTGAFSHASPPTSTSAGGRGSVWYDPVNKDRYDWIADNVVARYFADPTF